MKTGNGLSACGLAGKVDGLRHRQELEEAKKSALGALRAHLDDPYILIAPGRLYGSRGQFDKALEQFGRALKRNEWHLEALKMAGRDAARNAGLRVGESSSASRY